MKNKLSYVCLIVLLIFIASSSCLTTNRIVSKIRATHNSFSYRKPEATVMGFADVASGIGRLPIVIADMLYKDLSVSWIPTDDRYVKSAMRDMPVWLRPLFGRSYQRPADVVLFTDMLWDTLRFPARKLEQTPALIKIAYSMLESTAIPQEWVVILNQQFDAVVVPDVFLVEVYKNSGVKIPVFVLPIPLYLEEFLTQPAKHTNSHTQKPFVFGNASALWPHKNHETIIKAFSQAFGNSPKVKLRINGRMARVEVYQKLKQLIERLGASNIELSVNKLSQAEYNNFMSSLDCYVNLSTGEGFSIPPYEALALGIPVIATDNTAQSSLCKTGFVRAVKSKEKVPAYYNIFERACGHGFNCSVTDAMHAFKDVYTHQEFYRKQAQKGRFWVKRFLKSALKNTYKTLFKPLKIKLGSENTMTPDGTLTTTDQRLYNKYKRLIDSSHNKYPDNYPGGPQGKHRAIKHINQVAKLIKRG